MGDSIYNSLDIKIQMLENKLNSIMTDTRYSSDFYSKKKYHLAESIKNLLKLTEDIKNELRYYSKSVPKNNKTEHLYRKVCTLESELYNLLYNYSEEPTNEVSSYDSEDSCRPCKARVRSDYAQKYPISCNQGYTPLESQSIKKKSVSHRREPKYEVGWEGSSDSHTNISCYFSSSGSSSSFELLDYQKRVPVYIRKSKSSFQDQYPVRREVRHPTKAPIYIRKSRSSIQDRYPIQREKRHPSRLPVYIRKSKSSFQDRPPKRKEVKHSERNSGYKKKSRARPIRNTKRVKKKKRNPFWKRSSSQFEIHKYSDSDKTNVGTDDLQTEDVFLIKKKRKSKYRIRTEKTPSRGRLFISRLKRVMSRKSRPRSSGKNGSIKVRSSTENYKEEYPAVNSSKKRFGIAKYKDNKPMGGEIHHKYSNESFYVVENRDRKKSRSKVPSRIGSQLSKPITVARSVNLRNNPFSNNNNHIFYLQDSSFIIVPNKISDKKLYNINANVESISKSSNNNLAHMNSSKPSNTSNQHKKVSSNYNNNVSNNKILGSFQHLNSSLIENNSHVKEQYGFKSVSTNTTPHLKTYQIPNKTVFFGEANKIYSNNSKTLSYNDLGMKISSKSNKQSKSKLVLLKIIGNQNHEESKKSSSVQTKKSVGSKEISVSKGNSFQSAPVRNNTSKVTKGTTVPKVLENTTVEKNGAYNSFYINNTSLGNVDNSVYVLESNNTPNQGFSKSLLDLSKNNFSTHLANTPKNNISSSNIKPNIVNKTSSKVVPIKTVSKDSKNNRPELNKTVSLLKSTKSLPKLLTADEDQTLLRNQSTTDSASRAGSNISLNRTNSKAKRKNWLTRSVSKLSVLAKRTKKPKGKKAEKSLSKEIYATDLSDKNKTNSIEKLPSTENVSKTKSWTSVKRVMSGAGSFIKLGKNNKKKKQAPLKKSESEQKQKKKPLLKRMFSKTRSKTEMIGDRKAKPTNKSEYDGDLTSISSQLSVAQSQYTKDLQSKGNLEGIHDYGYNIGGKPTKQVLNTKSFKSKPMNEASHKQPTLTDNPKPYSYSLHYSKKKHKCVEMSSVPSLPCLVSYKCSPDSKVLWKMDQTNFNERQLNEFVKCNNYHEFLFKPIECECCEIHDKKVSKSCQERGEQNIFSDRCPSFESDDKLSRGLINCKLTSESDQFLSEGSDICDWKKIANEIK